jgi:hypothetical protein
MIYVIGDPVVVLVALADLAQLERGARHDGVDGEVLHGREVLQ